MSLTKRVYRLLFSLFILFISVINSQAQKIDKGINFQIGFANIHSGNLKDYYSYVKTQDPKLSNSKAHSNLGNLIGLGGRLVYSLNTKLGIQGELNLNYQSSKIFGNTKREDLNATSSGEKERVSSEATFRIFTVNLPILLRYKLTESKEYFVLGGFNFNYSANPSLKSNEEHVTSHYTNGIIVNSDLNTSKQIVSMNRVSPFNVMASIGIEKRFKRGMKNVSLALRGNYSLTKSELYSSKPTFYFTSYNNSVFSEIGKSVAESSSMIKLNDFRMASIFFTVTYHLVGKVKKKTKESK